MLPLLAILGSMGHREDPIVTPYFRKEPLGIQSASVSSSTIAQFALEEISVGLTATYDNPFNPADFVLDADVTTPSGSKYTIPGFLFRQFDRSLKDGKEVVSAKNDSDWRVRLCPTEIGNYTVVLRAKDRSGSVTGDPIHFTATSSGAHGFIGISSKNRQYFSYSDGTSYFPIGANVCWGNDKGTFSYDDWLPAYSKVGANYFRLWLGPSWVTFAIETPGKPEEGHGLGQIDLGDAWKLDQVLKSADALGMKAMLTIDSYNTLRAHNAYPAWDKSPYNKDNGGPLRIWTDFWTNSDVDRWYRAKLRYLVARYSAFQNVMSWEFWNEVDLTEDYSSEVVKAWHKRMGDALRSIDPYHHLLTTSIADSMGNRNLDLLPQLDYAQTHNYNSPDIAAAVLYQQARKSEWGKPHIVGEIGADASGPRTTDDPQGLQIHDPIWMSLATGSSGTAMPWWWDSLIAPKNLYSIFGAAANFIKGIDWPSEDFRRTNLNLSYQSPPKLAERRDLTFENGPVQWADGEFNHPQSVTIRGEAVEGDPTLPGIQHGVRNHRDWHNPVRFKVRFAKETRFEVVVGDVSGYGGATLQISIDGDPVMTRAFNTGENASMGQSVSKFAGAYAITIPKGEHTVLVENIGNDWFMVNYRFPSLMARTAPAIQGWCITGNSTALIWLRPEGRTWQRVIMSKQTFPATSPSYASLEGLASGDWLAEVWNTWSGEVQSHQVLHIGINGHVRIPVPSFRNDIAVKLTKVPVGKFH